MRFGFLALSFLPVLALAAEPAAPAPAAAAPAADAAPSRRLLGKVSGDRYFSPTGTFSMPLPELDEETGIVMDTPNIVVFRDRVATIITVAAFKMPPDERWNFETSNAKDYTVHFLKEFVIADFKEQFPETTPESAVFLPDLLGGTLLGYLSMPGGSAFDVDAIVRNHPDTKPPAAKRAAMIFVRDGWVFVLSSELAERITEMSTYILTTKDEDRILRERLLRTVNSLEFLPPAPATSAPAAVVPAAPGK